MRIAVDEIAKAGKESNHQSHHSDACQYNNVKVHTDLSYRLRKISVIRSVGEKVTHIS